MSPRRKRRRGRGRRAGNSGPGILIAGVAIVLLWGLAGARDWAMQRPAFLWPVLGGVLVVVVGSGLVLVRGQRAARRRWEQDLEAARVRHVELRQTMVWWDQLPGNTFEEEVASLLRRDGYQNVRRVGGRSDGGVDVVGRTPDGRGLAVQCKRWNPDSWIGVSVIRDFASGARLRNAPVALLVTTATHASRDAKETARRTGIVLILRSQFVRWAQGTRLDHILGERTRTDIDEHELARQLGLSVREVVRRLRTNEIRGRAATAVERTRDGGGRWRISQQTLAELTATREQPARQQRVRLPVRTRRERDDRSRER